MEKWLIVERISNSCGNGYAIRATCNYKGSWYPVTIAECAYYGYSKRDAERKFRIDNKLVGIRFQRLEY